MCPKELDFQRLVDGECLGNVRCVIVVYTCDFPFRALLGCQTSQLCKSMLMENTAWQPMHQNDNGTSPTNSRFYLVVLQ